MHWLSNNYLPACLPASYIACPPTRLPACLPACQKINNNFVIVGHEIEHSKTQIFVQKTDIGEIGWINAWYISNSTKIYHRWFLVCFSLYFVTFSNKKGYRVTLNIIIYIYIYNLHIPTSYIYTNTYITIHIYIYIYIYIYILYIQVWLYTKSEKVMPSI